MKILQLSSAQAFGGGERHLADLSNELARRGHSLYAVVRPNSPLLPRLTWLAHEQIKLMPLRNALDVASANELARFVKENQIQIIHAHMARDYSLAAYAAHRNPTARFIVTRHVLFKLNRWHRRTLSRAARVIAVSEAVARELQSQNLLPASRITLVHNGVDVESLAAACARADRREIRSKFNLARDSLLVGAIGQLNPNKGHDDLLRAMKLVVESVPNAHLVIAGSDPSPKGETASSLKRIVADLGLRTHVQLLGEIENPALLLPALDVFVSASHTESFGLAIVEAMACCLPVVSTNTEGAREVIDEPETGLIAPIGDSQGVATSIIKLLKDEKLRETMGRRGNHRARERFTLKQMIDATERIYLEVLGHRDAGI